MKVYAVVFSNYDPAEVDSLHFREEDAQARAKEKNDADASFPPAWEVTPMEVLGEMPMSALLALGRAWVEDPCFGVTVTVEVCPVHGGAERCPDGCLWAATRDPSHVVCTTGEAETALALERASIAITRGREIVRVLLDEIARL